MRRLLTILLLLGVMFTFSDCMEEIDEMTCELAPPGYIGKDCECYVNPRSCTTAAGVER